MWSDNNKINNLIMNDICKKLNDCNISIEQLQEYYERNYKEED